MYRNMQHAVAALCLGVLGVCAAAPAVDILVGAHDPDFDIVSRLEGLGHNVTVSPANTWDSGFDYSAFDVVAFAFRRGDPADIGHLVDAVDAGTVGVVFFRGFEAESTALALGMIGGMNLWWQTPTDLNVVNNSHFITETLSLDVHNLGYTFMSLVRQPGPQTTTLASGPDGAALVVHDTRRVVVTTYYGHAVGHDDENETGLEVTQRSILWAAGASSACPEDLDGSGAVDFGDVLAILSAWGNKGGPEDLDGSGTVDFGDILIVLAEWGPCP